MKKGLLALFLSTGIIASAQLTTSDTLSTGVTRSYFNLDSNATSLSSVTGTAVTWDYSDIAGYYGTSPNNDIIVASSTTYASDFPTTPYCEKFDNGVWTFFDNIGTEVHVTGFAYDDGTNDILVTYDTDDLIALQLPMNQGDSYSDPVSGTASTSAVPATVTVTGSADIEADGTGTLKVGTSTFSNVIRIHTNENISGTYLTQTINIQRESFVYYDLDDANPMPVFRHDHVVIDLDVLGNFGFRAVYSKFPVSNYVGINEVAGQNKISIYPNPASKMLNVKMDDNVTKVVVLNTMGQVVYTNAQPQTSETIDVSGFESGMYLVQLYSNEGIRTEKVTIK